jgi:quinol monooxygenase YgiN
MSETALFIKHRALPGKRDEVHRIWEKHLQPNIAANPAHEAYFYCYDDDDPDAICVFQQYADRAASQDFLAAPWYAAYLSEVTPFLSGQPEIRAATPVWSKRTAP